ncbi:hypothetical protein N7448_010574 [Penicillium atrosanguineum]|nr:hypothetical protein N7448_010574 [Penicillium atrosanguineum]
MLILPQFPDASELLNHPRLYAMSLSKPWSHFGPHHPFPEKQNYYRDPFPPSLLPPLGFSISAAFAPDPTMSNANMNALPLDEMERFQKLSNEFEPDVQGPLVSTKQSSHSIAMDYANADPTLATKTSALAITHPMTRIMKGDGNCGWRGMLFVGLDPTLYEIFVDATEDAFAQTLAAIQNGEQDETYLVNAFNDEFNSNSIITHFRLLTSTWMKLNPQQYQAFLSGPLDEYCAKHIDPLKTEIDQVGLQALLDGIIQGSGFGVEILYLDRSEGDAVTPHQLVSGSTPNGPTIRLLYRPGHYDLLYRAEQTVNMAPMVNLQYGMTSNYTPLGPRRSLLRRQLKFDVHPQSDGGPRIWIRHAHVSNSLGTSNASKPISNIHPPGHVPVAHPEPRSSSRLITSTCDAFGSTPNDDSAQQI